MQVTNFRFLIAICLLPACNSIGDARVANNEDVGVQSPVRPHVMMSNGKPMVAGSQFADDAILTKIGCHGTLLTNSWVLTAQHCEQDYHDPAVRDVVYVNQPCTSDADCAPRNATCKEGGRVVKGRYCGVDVRKVYRNPCFNFEPGLGDQIDLWQLEAPIFSGVNPVPHSIAQPIWYGDAASLLNNKTITIVGHCEFCTQKSDWAWNTFTYSSYGWPSFGLSDSGGSAIQNYDSGGPGYYSANGLNYLTGVTQTVGSQHDLVETFPKTSSCFGGTYPSMYSWIDDTLFDNPRVLRSNVQAVAMAGTSTGAVLSFLSGGSYYFSQCDSEPCDSRGAWSVPEPLMGSVAGYAPAVAVEADGTAEVVVPASDGVHVIHKTKGVALGSSNLGGLCTSPAAIDSRPGTDPSILDVVCQGNDGAIWINQRVQANGWQGFYSLGAPAAGLAAGVAPAVVSQTADVTHVFVVGGDGQIWIRTGVVNTGWLGWAPLGGNDGGNQMASVAAASYDQNRIDVVAVNTSGGLRHRIWAGEWSREWTRITRGYWSSTVPPFAATYSGKHGLLNVGGISSGTAYIQRYSDFAVPQTTITSPVNGATFTAPVTMTISATASSAYGSISKVDLWKEKNASIIGTATTAPYSFTWPNVPVGTHRIFTEAFDGAGNSARSTWISFTVNPPVVPPASAPTYLTASVTTPGQVQLSWLGVPYATQYVVRRGTLPQGPFTDVATNVTTTSYVDTAVTSYTNYYYVVAGANSAGVGPASAVSNVAPVLEMLPSGPSLLSASVESPNSVYLWWSNDTIGASSIVMERSKEVGREPFEESWVIANTVTSYTDTSATPGTTYRYRVRAFNSLGYGPYSNTVTATTPTCSPACGSDQDCVNGACVTRWAGMTCTTTADCPSYATCCNGSNRSCDGTRLPSGDGTNSGQFVVSADGLTVTDTVTGLVWQRGVLSGQTGCDGTKCPWNFAGAVCGRLNLGGITGWRLPTMMELSTIVNFKASYPAIDSVAFPSTPWGNYWTSTPYSGASGSGWIVSFGDGNAYFYNRGNYYNVRCVR